MSTTLLNAIDKNSNWQELMKPKKTTQKIDIPRGYGKKMVDDRWKILLHKNEKYKEYLESLGDTTSISSFRRDAKDELLDPDTYERSDVYKDNVENFIGTVKVPVGIAGPVLVNGMHAQGEYFVPLATTEAALVASINRGISCINQSGGCTSAVILEGISRDPAFIFENVIEVAQFYHWSAKQFQNYKATAEKTTRFGKLIEIQHTIEGNVCHIKFMYTSGDASGQNITTIATEAICFYIMENSPIRPQDFFLECGMSGDKKGNSAVLKGVRGKRVVAECIIPRTVIETTLHANVEKMVWSSNVGIRGLIMNGTIGSNLHFSNPITALAIATGQDPACAAEAQAGIAKGEITKNGDFHITVTMANLLVATVGGGTKLPSQRACLELMGLFGAGKANAYAEVLGAVCIAAEVSLGAAIVSGDFARAHKILARDTSEPINLQKDSLDESFVKAQAALVKLSNLPSKDVILDIYGLYKQITVGDVNIERPSFFSLDLKAKAKYDAWYKKRGLSKDEAMKQYVEIVLQLIEDEKKRTK